jgi:polysaccharide export outer membrane protein
MKPLVSFMVLMLALSPGVAATAATVPAQPAATYHIGAGDQLGIDVIGEAALSQSVLVAGDGSIGLPLAGTVHVGGLTPTEAAASVAASLRKFIRDPEVTVAVNQQGQMTVMVLGDVKEAGKYLLRHGSHVSDAITSAGGMAVTAIGAYPTARVVQGDGTVKEVPLEAVLRGGDLSRDAELSDGAAIYVPGAAQFEVQVLGAVDAPGTITVSEGDRLSIAIAKAGNGKDSRADLNHILVTRTEPDGKTASHPVDLYKALEEGDIRYDPRLRKGDVVYVPIASQTHGALTNGLFILEQLVGY